jgi:serine/threonine protein kinase
MGNQNTKHFSSDNQISDCSESSFKIPEKDRDLLEGIGFDIKGLVGFGSYGTVYHGFYRFIALGFTDIKGKHLEITPEQEFACKFINIKDREEKELLKGKSIIRKFVEREKLLLSKLSHPNILRFHMCINLGNCQFITLGDHPNRPLPEDEVRLRASYDRNYLFMDFADFGNLENYLKGISAKNSMVSESQAKSWCKQIGSGLQYLHQQNVIHGNIKTENVLLFKEFNDKKEVVIVAKLSDFGFSGYFDEICSHESKDRFDENSSTDSEESFVYQMSKGSSPAICSCSSFGKISVNFEQFSDIYSLAPVFQRILKSTNFQSQLNQQLAHNLVSMIDNFECDDFETVLKHQWISS